MTSERELEALAERVEALATDFTCVDESDKRDAIARDLRELARRLQPARVPEKRVTEAAKAISTVRQGNAHAYRMYLDDARAALSAAPAAEAGKAKGEAVSETYFQEAVAEALGRWPESSSAILFMASAVGPTLPITAEDIAWANEQLAANPAPESREADAREKLADIRHRLEERGVVDVRLSIDPGTPLDKALVDAVEVLTAYLEGQHSPAKPIGDSLKEPEAGQREGVEATLRRAADMLDGFEKALVRYAPIADIEEWPYHPEITETAETLRRIASAQQAGNPWDSIISEIQRRAESEGADERGSDFTVTISIGEYRKAMRTGSRGEGEG